MLQVKVTLDFDCCACTQSVHVTLQCAGDGLAKGPRAKASVNVPCPNCGSVNQLLFDPSGTVHAVQPYTAPRMIPQPSMN